MLRRFNLDTFRFFCVLVYVLYNYPKWLFSTPGGVFSYLPHHLDLAREDSVGHSTFMSVLARRRAIMGWLVS